MAKRKMDASYEIRKNPVRESVKKKDPPKRSVLEEIGNSITHGVGALLAVAALVVMLLSADSPRETAAVIIYSVGMIIAFSVSCLYHAFPHGSAVKRLFRRFDYSSIYLLIGATFAPSLLCLFENSFGMAFFITQWVLIGIGITLVGVFGPCRLRYIHIPTYVTLGWSALMLLPGLITESLPLALFILAGGVAYSIGIIPFAIKTRASHFIWHFFVLVGAFLQWVGNYFYLIK